MCCTISYVMAAATGTRREADRPTEWTDDRERDTEERDEEAAVAAA